MELRIAGIGERMPAWVGTAVEEYTGRMPPQLPVRLIALPASRRRRSGDVVRATEEEGERLMSATAGCLRVALDERGRSLTTGDLARRLDGWLMDGRDVAFLIGGADGLSQRCLEAADHRWSLSALTFPHMLARVILAEQLYRAWTVLSNHPYHRE